MALEELREFAYDNELYTDDDLKISNKLHLQTTNKDFRDLLKKKYNYDTSEIENFNDKIGQVEEVDLPINFSGILNNNPIKKINIIEKLKKLKIKGIKKLAIRIGAIATIAVLGITGIKSCSKKGISEDLVTVESDTNSEDPVEYITQDPTPEENINAGSNLPVFQSYLNQSSEATRKYMTNFKKNLKSFNKIAKIMLMLIILVDWD